MKKIFSILCLLTATTLQVHAGTEISRTEIIISSPDTVASYDCAGRTVNIPAPDSRITLKGSCPVITVAGPNTIVYAEAVNKINIYGPDAKVYYQKSTHPSRPVMINAIGPGSAAIKR
ncbi:hypothetical protein B9T33_00565 [Acinetobacter sp. ANC 5054]|uniref:DUF3060 domain-containing protein n=1 Tax=Acinetobacter sp. ANC 5054 TaxID=1977877 RepID=UPI000A332F3B|nr:DUF3060 domain-containing protein [Acinetobacter sp. ANC 5054]OTG84323.1 hypothetical protein B9T33_00565 [Acinetobacter sp. ANC 5054]